MLEQICNKQTDATHQSGNERLKQRQAFCVVSIQYQRIQYKSIAMRLLKICTYSLIILISVQSLSSDQTAIHRLPMANEIFENIAYFQKIMSCSIHDFTKYTYVCVYVMLSLMVSSQIVPQKILPVCIPDPLFLAFEINLFSKIKHGDEHHWSNFPYIRTNLHAWRISKMIYNVLSMIQWVMSLNTFSLKIYIYIIYMI